jgi:nicotinamide mononucleotide transporter
MDFLKHILDIENSMLTIYSYQMSYIEFIGTSLGLISVWLAAKANIHTWTTGIINVIAFFIIYYQVQLYSDMFLQVFFLLSSFFGIFQWFRTKPEKEDKKISSLNARYTMFLLACVVILTALLGIFMSQIHLIFPSFFTKAAAYPYLDALTTILSVFATFLMAYKRIECWALWILTDLICIGLYIQKGIVVIALEYAIFFIMASWGFIQWQKSITYAKRLSIG